MKVHAFIRDESNNYYPDAKHAWKLSRKTQEIFNADDRGDAVFITDENSLHDLEVKFAAPAGFTYFLDFREVGYHNRRDASIVQYGYPIAKKGTSWATIFKEVDRSGLVLVPMENSFSYYDRQTGQRVDPYGKRLPQGYYATQPNYRNSEKKDRLDAYTYLYGFDDTYIGLQGESFSGFVRVIADNKRAKRLQGYKRRRAARKNKEPRSLQISDISITQLRELLKAFIAEYVPTQNFVCVSSCQPNKGFYQGISGQAQQRNKTRRLLIQEINSIRQACIRSRRKWREMSAHNKSFVYYSYGRQENAGFFQKFLNHYMQYVPVLLKSKNPDFQAFARWLRYEQALEKRRLKQEELKAEAEQEAKTKKKPKKRRAAKKKPKTAKN